MSPYVKDFMDEIKGKNPAQPEFHQAVYEVVNSISLVLDRHPEYRKAKIVERIAEPERVLMFRVSWMDDAGEIQVNRGYRIQMMRNMITLSGSAIRSRILAFRYSGWRSRTRASELTTSWTA